MEGDDKIVALAIAAQTGSEAAFVEICGMLKLELFRIAIGMLRDNSLALEAIDETVFRAFKSMKKLKQPQFISTWCHDMLKVQKREQHLLTLSQELCQNASGSITKEYDNILLKELLNALPEDLKQIISLKYFSDLTLTEISTILQLPLGTVKSKLNRALKLLRLEMKV